MRSGVDCKGKIWEETSLRGKRVDATGVRFGKLVALFPVKCNGVGQWLCKCDCGNELVAEYYYLNSGKVKSCDCLRQESRNKHFEIKREEEGIVGKKYGKLTVLNYVGLIDGMATYNCDCDCGRNTNVPLVRLKNGNTKSCGCLQADKSKQRWGQYREDQNIIGEKFGRLTVLEFVGIENDEAMYRFLCDCGKIIKKSLHSVKSGNTRSCGCLLDDFRNSTKYDIIGQRFGKLVVESYAGSNKFGGTDFNCLCDCGRATVVSRNSLVQGNTKSCGCMRSIGENNIRQILEDKEIRYKSQYSFHDLLSESGGYPLYDFAILDNENNVERLIEFDGEQHQRPYDYFGGEEKFLKVQKNDSLKNQYALSHNMPLVRIPYSKRDFMTLDDLLGDKYLYKGDN